MSRGRPLAVVAASLTILTGVATSAVAASAPLTETGTIRLAGADRYATSVKVSQSTFTTPQELVFIASGEHYADALAAGPAASLADAPILLVKKGSVPDVVKAELARLNPTHVVVVGGPASVSDATLASAVAAAKAQSSERVAGLDRYETAAKILMEGMGGADVVYVASGAAFPDALAGGVAAALEGGGLVLTAKNSLPPSTAAAIKGSAPMHVVILGGTASVSAAVEQQITSLLPAGAVVDRAAGQDRFETAEIIAEALWGNGARTAFLTSGTTFPDALNATPVAYVNDAPVLLTTSTCTPAATAFALSDVVKPELTVILGGESVAYDGPAVC